MKRLLSAVCFVLLCWGIAQAFTTLTVTATWTNPVADASHGAPTGARLERRSDAGSWVTAVTVGSGIATATDTAQPIGHTYDYRVISTNSFGDAAASNIATIVAFVPAAASGVTITFTVQ